MSEKTRSIIERIVIPSVLPLALVVAAFWGAQQSALAEGYKTGAEGMYQRAFSELCDSMNALQTALGKLRIVSSPSMSVLLLDEIWRLSGSSVSLMGQIPSSHVDTSELNAFLIRLGEYARSLTKKALAGSPASDEDRASLEELYTRCSEISEDLSSRLEIGDVPVEVVTADGYYAENDDSYKSTDEISKFPTLIYDGPYSEASEQRQPKGLSGGEVPQDEARAAAERLTGASELQCEESLGAIPSWDFSGADAEGREVNASISKTGGKMVWFMTNASGAAEGVPDEGKTKELQEAGLAWLSSEGFPNMRATYAQYYAGAALINFAPVMNGAIIYNDLIKVWLDVENHNIIGADARGYLNCHTERDFGVPKLSMEEAEELCSPDMEIVSRELALIPLSPETEALCWEFRGRYGEDEYIVYIDAETGDEREIFVIINTENGQLTL